jgi:hypothetical protein
LRASVRKTYYIILNISKKVQARLYSYEYIYSIILNVQFFPFREVTPIMHRFYIKTCAFSIRNGIYPTFRRCSLKFHHFSGYRFSEIALIIQAYVSRNISKLLNYLPSSRALNPYFEKLEPK